jgi:hypothetical protein
MLTGQQRHEREFDRGVLADDDFGDLRSRERERGGKLFKRGVHKRKIAQRRRSAPTMML